MLKKSILSVLALSLGLTFAGCARHPTDPVNDPLEGYNRFMYAFNTDIDHLVIRPIAIVYRDVTPPALKKGVTNGIDNLDEIPTFGNDFLQGRFKYMALDFWRLVINTTFGVGGLFDVASRWGLPKHVETFGLTLAKWRGGRTSAYFVIPILQPSTMQNAVGDLVDLFMEPYTYFSDSNYAYAITGVRIINKREHLLAADEMIKNAFDPYIFVRDATLQQEKDDIEKNQALK
ncbi:MAG: hypothetical protein ACD_70C00161G0003 [uncultured bacterium]|nr:MAG: hypothetical protein ACD_70C00161G0003 [uncultured bacterium]OGT26007.1 MAG: hypothetical protein A3B71_08190 [Gammaproteobacteria bacterium RIFCSPHIGHO2_02_FULL_42_43]